MLFSGFREAVSCVIGSIDTSSDTKCSWSCATPNMVGVQVHMAVFSRSNSFDCFDLFSAIPTISPSYSDVKMFLTQFHEFSLSPCLCLLFSPFTGSNTAFSLTLPLYSYLNGIAQWVSLQSFALSIPSGQTAAHLWNLRLSLLHHNSWPTVASLGIDRLRMSLLHKRFPCWVSCESA